MSYINEIKTKNGTTYDVQDKRLTDELLAQIGNIDLSKVPTLNRDEDNLSSEEVETYKGKVIYLSASDVVMLPIYISETEVRWVWFGNYEFYVTVYLKSNGEWKFDDEYQMFKGTKLYKHELKDSQNNIRCTAISTDNNPHSDLTANFWTKLGNVSQNVTVNSSGTGYVPYVVLSASLNMPNVIFSYVNGTTISTVSLMYSGYTDTVTPL